MAGLFKIHPTGGSSIVCDALDTIDTAEYLLISADMKEREREKIIYSEGKFDGSVINSTASIVTITLDFLVNGDTPEEVAGNLGTLKAAFFNPRGGYIEYRPVGYAGSVLSTFYKYLQSPPPQRLMESDAVQSSIELGFAMGQLYRFDIKIFSLATSDPDDIFSTVASGTVWTYTDGAEPGILEIPASSIKGDGLFPIISVESFESASVYSKEFVVSFCEVESGQTDLDWYEALASSSGAVDFSVSERFHTNSTSTGWLIRFAVQTTSSMFFGRCTPIVSYKTSDSTWQIRVIHATGGDDGAGPLTDWHDLPESRQSGFKWDLATLDSVHMPPFAYPDIMPISALYSQIGLEVRTKDSVPGNINLYGLLLPPVDGNSWIAKFISPELWASDSIGIAQGVAMNCPAGNNYMWHLNIDDVISHSWEKQGMSIRDAVMPKGSYQVRILRDLSYNWTHDIGGYENRTAVIVAGQFYTIYPFSES